LAKLLKNKKGFTLIEIVVAAVVLAAAISGLWASYIASKRYVVGAKARLMALHNAQYVLERLRQDVRADTWDQPFPANSLTAGMDYDVTSWLPTGDDTFTDKYSGKAEYDVTDHGGYREVILTMEWERPE